MDFTLRMLTVNDLVKDYDAVMSSVPRLKGSMRPWQQLARRPDDRGPT
jgi:hypothetical protein